MNRLLTENIDEIKALCTVHNVRSLFAFGSVGTDQFNEESDVNLLTLTIMIKWVSMYPIHCHGLRFGFR